MSAGATRLTIQAPPALKVRMCASRARRWTALRPTSR